VCRRRQRRRRRKSPLALALSRIVDAVDIVRWARGTPAALSHAVPCAAGWRVHRMFTSAMRKFSLRVGQLFTSCGPHAPHAAPFEFRRLLKRGGADNEFRNVSTSGNPNPTTKKQTKMGDREEVTLCRQDGQRWGTHIMHAMNSFVVHLGVRVEPLHALLRTRLQMSSRCPDVMCTRTTINLHAHGTHFSSVGSVCAGASMVSTACLAHPPRRLSLRFCNSDSSIV
jgi:hypothetical protein